MLLTLDSPHRVVFPSNGLTDHWISEIRKFTDLRAFEAKGKYTKEGEQVSYLISFFLIRIFRSRGCGNRRKFE